MMFTVTRVVVSVTTRRAPFVVTFLLMMSVTMRGMRTRNVVLRYPNSGVRMYLPLQFSRHSISPSTWEILVRRPDNKKVRDTRFRSSKPRLGGSDLN